MKTRHIGVAAAAGLTGLAALLTAPSLAQPQPAPSATPRPQFVWPERITNARALPANIGAERLRATMTGYARALGVRCTFCHVGVDGQPLSTFDFASDARPHKNIARGMIRMMARINTRELTPILGASSEPRVTCYTCHRGSSEPETALPPPPRPGTPPPPPPPPPQHDHH
jgi:hypothetical protein